jgi:hypothetical protein
MAYTNVLDRVGQVVLIHDIENAVLQVRIWCIKFANGLLHSRMALE